MEVFSQFSKTRFLKSVYTFNIISRFLNLFYQLPNKNGCKLAKTSTQPHCFAQIWPIYLVVGVGLVKLVWFIKSY